MEPNGRRPAIARRTIRWIAIGLCCLTLTLPFFQLTREPELQEIRPALLKQNPAVAKAYQNYISRGGTYQWGPNDCSVFVTDYLRAKGCDISRRLTTWDLSQPKNLQAVGYRVTASPPRPGDVLVYRYRNSRGEVRGHCGIVTAFQGKVWVVHNMATTGAVMQKLPSFDRMVRSSSPMTYLCYHRA